MPVVVNPGTPLAKRAVPVVKLVQEVCLRCSKKIGDGGENCVKKPNAKCEYCRRLKKECAVVPPEFRKIVNQLFRLLNSRSAGEEQDGSGDDDALEQARRSYIKDVEAFLRQEVKHGLTKRPKGDEIQLLQVQAINRLAKAAEGILDVLRFQSGIAPLGDADAPSDNEDNNNPAVEEEQEENEQEGDGQQQPDQNAGGNEDDFLLGGGALELPDLPNFYEQEEEGVEPPESPTAARDARAKRRRGEGPDDTEKPKEAKKKEKKKKTAVVSESGAENFGAQTTGDTQAGGEAPEDPPADDTTQPPRPRTAGPRPGPLTSGPFKKMTMEEIRAMLRKGNERLPTLTKGGKAPTSLVATAEEQGKRPRNEGAGSESGSPKKKSHKKAHGEERSAKRREKKERRAEQVVAEEEV